MYFRSRRTVYRNGKDLYENSPLAELFEQANEILGFRITDIMFEGTVEELKETKGNSAGSFTFGYIS
jgi:[acyl-carrier-protein] S-malonyltransferase